MIKLAWQGERELRRTLEALPVRVQRQVGRKALRPGATIVSRALKAAVPKLTDEDAAALAGEGVVTGKDLKRHIKKGIGRKAKTYRNTGTPTISVGPMYDYRSPGIDLTAGYLAERLEYGDADRAAAGTLRRAAEGVSGEAMRAMIEKTRQAVADAAREARRG